MTPSLRRLAVPLVGAGLVAIVVIVALVVLDLGGLANDSAASVPVIQIGSASVGQHSSGTASAASTMLTTSAPVSAGSGAGQGQGTGSTQGQSASPDYGSTIRAGRTTVVTEGIRVEPGQGYQSGSTPTATSATTATATTSTDAQSSTSTNGAKGSTSTRGARGSTPTSGAHGPSSTGSGR